MRRRRTTNESPSSQRTERGEGSTRTFPLRLSFSCMSKITREGTQVKARLIEFTMRWDRGAQQSSGGARTFCGSENERGSAAGRGRRQPQRLRFPAPARPPPYGRSVASSHFASRASSPHKQLIHIVTFQPRIRIALLPVVGSCFSLSSLLHPPKSPYPYTLLTTVWRKLGNVLGSLALGGGTVFPLAAATVAAAGYRVIFFVPVSPFFPHFSAHISRCIVLLQTKIWQISCHVQNLSLICACVRTASLMLAKIGAQERK